MQKSHFVLGKLCLWWSKFAERKHTSGIVIKMLPRDPVNVFATLSPLDEKRQAGPAKGFAGKYGFTTRSPVGD